MSKKKIAITIDESIVDEIDQLVERNIYPSRSQAIESVITIAGRIAKRGRLLTELAKLDPEEEIRLADEFMNSDGVEWPEY